MIGEIGHYALILALGLALLQSIVPMFGAHRNDAWLMAVAAPAAIGQFLFVALAFGMLTTAFVQSDFSVTNVYMNSHTAKPMLYKISGVWGNHEGSLLLWALILTLFGAALAVFGGNLPTTLKSRALAVQAMVGIGFLLFILLTSNPFTRIFPVPLDGRGLNPLLQDPGLAFHPPFLYLGYVGFSMAFSLAIAALIEGRVDPAWARWVRPWTLAAWCFLTIGIALGSWWAYYELGWGGWWFWDPVENASFMPWLVGTALLHSAVVVEKRDALKSWTILLAIIAFSFSLLGTFLVRSGVLTSVHAFATDPERGVFILAFLVLVVGGSLTLYSMRAKSLSPGGLFQPISREGGLILNNWLLSTAAATVLIGTLYPLFLDGLTGEKVSVGPPYFNGVFIPIMTPLFVAMAIGPFLSWKRADLKAVLPRLKIAGLAVLVMVGFVGYMSGEEKIGFILMTMLGMSLGVWLILAAFTEFTDRLKLFRAPLRQSLSRAAGLPKSAWGAMIAHSGMGILVLGIAASSAWSVETLGMIKPGEDAFAGPYRFHFEGAKTGKGPNYDILSGSYQVYKGDEYVTTLEPESRTFTTPPQQTTEAAIYPMISGDLYAVVGDPDGKGAYATRLYWKPLISWIWGGAIIMVIGGLVSLSDRRLRVGAPKRKKSEAVKPVAAE
jgi:cytochrome c-type biogenesis protein CcmF